MTDTPTPIKSVGYVILFVDDMTRSVGFYRDTLGVPVRFEDPNWTELDTAGTTVALHLAGDDKASAGGSPELVFQVEDVLDTRTRLAEGGLAIEAPKVVHEAGPDQVGVSCLFKDPDGHTVSVYGLASRGALSS